MRVLVRKQIHTVFASASSYDVWIQRELWLPFPPIVGMTITIKGAGRDGGDWSETLTEVGIVVDRSGEVSVRSYAEEDKHFYDQAREEGLSFMRVPAWQEVALWLEELYAPYGWDVSERREPGAPDPVRFDDKEQWTTRRAAQGQRERES